MLSTYNISLDRIRSKDILLCNKLPRIREYSLVDYCRFSFVFVIVWLCRPHFSLRTIQKQAMGLAYSYKALGYGKNAHQAWRKINFRF